MIACSFFFPSSVPVGLTLLNLKGCAHFDIEIQYYSILWASSPLLAGHFLSLELISPHRVTPCLLVFVKNVLQYVVVQLTYIYMYTIILYVYVFDSRYTYQTLSDFPSPPCSVEFCLEQTEGWNRTLLIITNHDSSMASIARLIIPLVQVESPHDVTGSQIKAALTRRQMNMQVVAIALARSHAYIISCLVFGPGLSLELRCCSWKVG